MASSTGVVFYPLNGLFPRDRSKKVDQSDSSFMEPTRSVTNSDPALVVSAAVSVLMDG